MRVSPYPNTNPAHAHHPAPAGRIMSSCGAKPLSQCNGTRPPAGTTPAKRAAPGGPYEAARHGSGVPRCLNSMASPVSFSRLNLFFTVSTCVPVQKGGEEQGRAPSSWWRVGRGGETARHSVQRWLALDKSSCASQQKKLGHNAGCWGMQEGLHIRSPTADIAMHVPTC
jgi:hypothetical protein